MKEWIMKDATFEADEINPGLAVSPWSGHRNFAYDLISNLKPQRVVELGTHYGCSFFSFLQACKDNNLNSEIVAIDCWEGDPQAGFYGEDVWDTVNRTIKEKFPNQNSRLIRKYFCDAAADVEDESADLIHIDGLHTYEAVKEDFTTWLPKLKPNGVMIFHDVNSKLKYGTNDFWEEITQVYKDSYLFHHSWGLGVLFPKGNERFKDFEAVNMSDKVQIYEYKAEYQLLEIQIKDHIKMVEERDKSIKSMTAMIDDRDAEIKSMTKMIDDRDAEIKSMTKMIDDRDAEIKSMTAMINDRDASIKSMTAMIDDRDAGIKSMTAMIDDRDAAIKSMTAMIDDRDARIRELEGNESSQASEE